MHRPPSNTNQNDSPLNLDRPADAAPATFELSRSVRLSIFAVVAVIVVGLLAVIVMPRTNASSAEAAAIANDAGPAPVQLAAAEPADNPAPPVVAAADPQPQQAAANAVDLSAKALLEQTVDRYRSLDSYSDKMTLKQDVSLIPPGEEDAREQSSSWPVNLAYAQDQKLNINDEIASVITNGQTTWQVWHQADQYTKSDVGSSVAIDDLTDHPVLQSLTQHPLGQVFLPNDDSRVNPFYNITPQGNAAAESKAGQPGKTINARTDMGGLIIPTKIWISDATNLIGSIELDFTQAQIQMMARQMPPNMPRPVILSAVISMNLSDVQTNQPLKADTFTYEPKGGMKEVTGFENPNAQSTNELVGSSAPDFNAPSLTGDRLKLADLRGKVVVLDFWATWCGPCRVAMPHLQDLSEAYAGKDVQVLGINSDAATDRRAVVQMVKEFGLTFPQVMDPDKIINQRYHITGIPTTVVIGKDGRILKAFVGFSPDVPDMIEQIIDKELAKES